MQGEKRHGITWHEMIECVDAGRIFKQQYFAIDDNETAFSLNTKCYAAAISSFSELVDDLASGNALIQTQNLNERSFYPLSKRPPSGCVLSWSGSARELCNFVRALNFGPHGNPLGLPKLAVGDEVVIVPELEEVDSFSASLPGTITDIDASFVKIATGDGEVLVSKLLTIDGHPLSLSTFVEIFHLYKGYRFEELDAQTAMRITAYNASICQYEIFWATYLKTLEKAPIPYAQRNTANEQGIELAFVIAEGRVPTL